VKLSNQIFGLLFATAALSMTSCGILPNNSAQPTRATTQTPLIVYVPVTTTPEPATVTPLATITSSAPTTPTRTSTRAVVAKATATKTKTAAPVAAGPTALTAPVCAFGPPLLIEPDRQASIMTKENSPAVGASFIFKWTPPENIGGDDIGYKIHMDSVSQTGKPVTSVNVYISHNKFISEGQKKQFVYDANRVWYLKEGSNNSTVTFYISVVKFSGAIDDLGNLSGTASECSGSQSEKRNISLIVQ